MCWVDVIEKFKQLQVEEQEHIYNTLKQRHAAELENNSYWHSPVLLDSDEEQCDGD